MASLFTFENLYRAYLDCRRKKRGKQTALAFEVDAERQLLELTRELQDRTYCPSPSFCFVAKNDKHREVFAADFRDRVVHRLLFNLINPEFDALFIPESFSCHTGKGSHWGIHTLNNSIMACSNHYQRDCYILKLDIKGNFMNSDKTILKQILYRGIT